MKPRFRVLFVTVFAALISYFAAAQTNEILRWLFDLAVRITGGKAEDFRQRDDILIVAGAGSLLFGYAFLATVAPGWPPPMLVQPSLSAIAAVVLALSMALGAERGALNAIRRGDVRAAADGYGIAALAMLAAVVALLAFAWMGAPGPAAHAYGAVVWVLVAYGAFHGWVALLMLLFVRRRLDQGFVSAARTVEPRVTRQWLRNGAVIAGATGTSYSLTAADRGKRVSVRYVATAGAARVESTSASRLVAAGVIKTTRKPAIVGKAKVGTKVRANTGRWNTSGVTVRYRWLRGGKPIAGATKATYRLKKADRGKRIRVRVTVSKPGYATVTVLTKVRKIPRK